MTAYIPAPIAPHTVHRGRKCWFDTYPRWGPIKVRLEELLHPIDPQAGKAATQARTVFLGKDTRITFHMYRYRVLRAEVVGPTHLALTLFSQLGGRWVHEDDEREIDKMFRRLQ